MRYRSGLCIVLLSFAPACSSKTKNDGSGGASGAGATAATGGSTATGGSAGAGGSTSDASVAKLGKAIQWNGACAELGPADALGLGDGGPFTIELWYKAEKAPSKYQVLLAKGGSGVDDPGWEVKLTFDATAPSPDGPFAASVCVANGTSSPCKGSDLVDATIPRHYAVTRTLDGDGGGGTIAIHALSPTDGTHEKWSEPLTVETWTSTEPFHFSRCNGLSPAYGIMDEVRIWKTARSHQELDQYAREKVSCTDPDLIAYWDFDDTAGNVLHDCKSNLDVGIITGAGSWASVASPF